MANPSVHPSVCLSVRHTLYLNECTYRQTLSSMFNSVLKNQHCLQVILPEVKTSSLHLRQKGHVFDLPRCTLEIHKRSFFFATVFV